MKKLSKLLNWVDDNILQTLLILFIFVITLYPKIPLIRLTYTYIAIRGEDFFVALIFFVYAIQLLRRKVHISKTFVLPFLIFWISILASLVFGIFVSKSLIHYNIAVLHTLRRLEYMGIFFIALSAVNSFKAFRNLLLALVLSMLLVCLYGFGQRFVGFPAISTMNAEFAKGIFLTLTPDARLASTFAGHYDLAAYLVLLLPIIWGFIITLGKADSEIANFAFLKPFFWTYQKVTSFFGYVLYSISSAIKNKNETYLSIQQSFALDKEGGIVLVCMATIASLITASIFSSLFIPIISIFAFGIIGFIFFYKVNQKYTLFFISACSIAALVLTASRTSFIAYIISMGAFLLFFRKYKYLLSVVIITVLMMTLSQSLSQRFLDTFQIKRFLINERTGEV
ncbi:MAG: hypothetical protein ACMG6E_00720, partial [Candidatus Roizmanbacteria bacterium]